MLRLLVATRRDVTRLSGAMVAAADLAREDLAAWLAAADLSRPEYVRDELVEVLPRLVDRYGDLAASAAAQWYEELRREAVGGSYEASLGDLPSPEAVEGTARWAAGRLWSEDPADLLRVLSGPVGRYVAYAGRETVARNVARDPARPRWARVPAAGGCCAWCLMLASRGFVYASDKTAGGDHPYHDDCGCQPVPEWEGQASHIEGYDPDSYFDLYRSARAAVVADGDLPTDSAVASRMRRLSASVRDAVDTA